MLVLIKFCLLKFFNQPKNNKLVTLEYYQKQFQSIIDITQMISFIIRFF